MFLHVFIFVKVYAVKVWCNITLKISTFDYIIHKEPFNLIIKEYF